jgi:hypothetical protein
MSGHATGKRIELEDISPVEGRHESSRTVDNAMDEYGPSSSQYGDKELDRRTVRKLDFVLLPFLALLFLFNSLDRSNVSITPLWNVRLNLIYARLVMQRYARTLPFPASFLTNDRPPTSQRILGWTQVI